MKKIILTAAIALSTSLIYAQGGFGIKAGVNFANIQAKSEDSDVSISPSSQTSFNVGVFKDFKLSETIVFQPALSFTGKGYKLSSSDTFEGENYSYEEKLNTYYLEIPFNVLAKLSLGSGKFLIGAGPYAALGLSGKGKASQRGTGVDAYSETYKVEFGGDSKSMMEEEKLPLRRTDFGLNFTTGYQLSNGISLNVNYALGLSNILPKSETTTVTYGSGDTYFEETTTLGGGNLKNKVLSVSVGFSF